MSCYSSDLMLRQYTRVKSLKGNAFTYKDLKTVYTIVIYEKSPDACLTDALSDIYLHHGRTVFDTGIELKLLQEFYVVCRFVKHIGRRTVKEKSSLRAT